MFWGVRYIERLKFISAFTCSGASILHVRNHVYACSELGIYAELNHSAYDGVHRGVLVTVYHSAVLIYSLRKDDTGVKCGHKNSGRSSDELFIGYDVHEIYVVCSKNKVTFFSKYI